MTLTTRLDLKLNAAMQTVLDLVTASAPLTYSTARDLADGGGANQANKLFSDQRTIGDGASEDLDLNGGVLTDSFGATLVFAGVKCLIVISLPTNTTNLTLFGDANSVPILNTAATTTTLTPGGIFVYFNPSATGAVVTAGTGDIIQIANGAGASAVYNIIIVGD